VRAIAASGRVSASDMARLAKGPGLRHDALARATTSQAFCHIEPAGRRGTGVGQLTAVIERRNSL
jgi:hypothetical protein